MTEGRRLEESNEADVTGAEGRGGSVWSSEDIETLIHLWSAYGSVMLIAAIMQRPPSAIQTRASRCALPKRPHQPGPRSAWTDAEDDYLRSAVACIENGERIDLLACQKNMESSGISKNLDGIAKRMALLLGIPNRDFVKHIAIPEQHPSPKADAIKTRICPRCEKKFAPTHRFLFVCPQCKGSSDWQDGNAFYLVSA